MFYYNKKDNEIIAKLGINLNDGKAKLYFTEAIAIDRDDYVEVFAYATKADETIKTIGTKQPDGSWKNTRDDSFIFDPQIVRITINQREHTREYKGNKTKKTPTPIELYIVEQIKTIGFTTPDNLIGFKGQIEFDAPESTLAAIEKQTDNNIKVAFGNMICQLEPNPELVKLSNNQLEASSNSSNKSGYSGYSKAPAQTEISKLKDRLEFCKRFLMDDFTETTEVVDTINLDTTLVYFEGRKAGLGTNCEFVKNLLLAILKD